MQISVIAKTGESEVGKKCKNQCRNPVSNRGPYDLQSYALPTELLRQCYQPAAGPLLLTVPAGDTKK